MLPFLKKHRRWIMGGGAVFVLALSLGLQLYNGEGAVKASCLKGGGTWKEGACTFH